jgi:hypothetical protein
MQRMKVTEIRIKTLTRPDRQNMSNSLLLFNKSASGPLYGIFGKKKYVAKAQNAIRVFVYVV